MKTWFVEHFSPENGLQYLIKALKAKGLPFVALDWTHSDVEIPLIDGDVIFFGSQELGERFRNRGKVFLGSDSFNYENYLHSKLLLNPGEKIKLSELKAHAAGLFTKHKEGFFIRPNSWRKDFSGQVLTAQNFNKNYSNLEFYIESDVDVIIAPLKTISRETRILCINNALVTASGYVPGNMDFQEEEKVDKYQDFFEQIKAEGILPDSCCTIDLAHTPDGLKLVEFNPISTSAIYKCNPNLIIEALRE